MEDETEVLLPITGDDDDDAALHKFIITKSEFIDIMIAVDNQINDFESPTIKKKFIALSEKLENFKKTHLL